MPAVRVVGGWEASISTTDVPGRPSTRRRGCPGRSSSGALHLDSLLVARFTECGTTAMEMEAGAGLL